MSKDGITKEILKTRNFKTGYQIHHGVWKLNGNPDTHMKWATNYNGDYIGDSKTAHYLCVKRGIKPEVIPGNKVCSIGFCEKEQKWYGWSHRAIYGYGIGDVIKENSVDSEYLPVGLEAKTLNDAKQMAISFARSVS